MLIDSRYAVCYLLFITIRGRERERGIKKHSSFLLARSLIFSMHITFTTKLKIKTRKLKIYDPHTKWIIFFVVVCF